MREPLRDRGRLLHIQDAIDTILERTEKMSYDDLTADKILFGGIVYYTMIIGEASYKLSKVFKEKYTDTDWEIIANMRHHLVHGYYQVNALDVWNVIQQDLRPLREQISKYLSETDWDAWEQQDFDYTK
ncbi:MAG: DUF86 domain-containing protein [Bacteroidaceae bacterium]|nr:DUF86 domain-containing protein [Bacteroidaceae bacterium]